MVNRRWEISWMDGSEKCGRQPEVAWHRVTRGRLDRDFGEIGTPAEVN